MRTILVEVTLTLPVEIPAEWDEETAKYDIEEVHCPGTGYVGSAIESLIEEHQKSETCWGCSMNGENKIVQSVVGE